MGTSLWACCCCSELLMLLLMLFTANINHATSVKSTTTRHSSDADGTRNSIRTRTDKPTASRCRHRDSIHSPLR
uniref:Putative secreted protein n=1 Tax=Anopheles darlingi TaxID=43151 RepID=A0A2M4DSL1_ANODA